MNLPLDRQLPNDTKSELALLSAAIVDPNTTLLHAGMLPVAAFYNAVHGKLWTAILACYNAGTAIGIETVMAQIASNDQADLSRLLSDVLGTQSGFAAMTGEYAKLITERWHRRRLIEAGHKLVNQAFDTDTDASTVATEAMHALTHMNLNAKGPAHVTEYLTAAQDRINKGIIEKSEVTGLDTGLKQLNMMTHGMHSPDLWILAARPSLGKTSLATTIACNVAGAGHKVLFFSLEQSGASLTQRMISGYARVNMRRLRNLPDEQVHDIGNAVQSIAKLPLWIDERGGLTVTQIRGEARRMAAVNGVELVIVDYIGIMRPSHPRQDRYEHITEASGELKNMAKELGCPVLVLSQLNRLMAREKRRPRLDDLRESGAIEQDADVIVLLSGDVELNDLPENWQEKVTGTQLPKLVIADVGKNREGATGFAYLTFSKENTRYDDIF